jgi:hypothetical protein
LRFSNAISLRVCRVLVWADWRHALLLAAGARPGVIRAEDACKPVKWRDRLAIKDDG